MRSPAAAMERLGEEIAKLSAHIDAASHRLLVLIARFDRRFREAGGGLGFRSTAHWLSWRTGLGRVAARERVRMARALERLPVMSRAMARGELSYSKVRALTRVATPETEAELVEFALHGTAAHVERLVRAWRKVDRVEAAEAEARRRSRRLSLHVDDDGTWVIRGRLAPEAGALLRQALRAAGEVLYRRRRDEPDPAGEPTAPERRAEALGLVAEWALGGGGTDEAGEVPVRGRRAERFQVVVHATGERLGEEPAAGGAVAPAPAGASPRPVVDSAEAPGDSSEAPANSTGFPDDSTGLPDDSGEAPGPGAPPGAGKAPVAGATPERSGSPTTAAGGSHRALRALLDRGGGTAPRSLLAVAGGAMLEEGRVPLSPAAARRLACEASRVEVRRDRDGSVLDVGRRSRTVPPALRRALEVRDGGCRFPGCGLRFCDAHHVVHWSRGGTTSLDNLVLLCRRHHRAVHERGFGVEVLDGQRGVVRFSRPDGRPLPEAPPMRAPGAAAGPNATTRPDAARALARANRERGIEIDAWTATPDWNGERLDLGLAIDLLWRPRKEE